MKKPGKAQQAPPGEDRLKQFSVEIDDQRIFSAFLSRGYLPEVFPPIFSSKEWASKIRGKSVQIEFSGELNKIPYSCTKRGNGRRYFDFVHPASAVASSAWMSRHWVEISKFCNTSKTAPIDFDLSYDEDKRSFATSSFDKVLDVSKKRLAGARHVVRADVAKYYSSIYTHIIPWALNGKKVSKADRKANSTSVYGNGLDWATRIGQGDQTKGISVGPDFSRVIGELVGSAIDHSVLEKIKANHAGYVRNIDDFCIGAHDLTSAEEILHALQESLRSFELELNDEKTSIQEASTLIDESWVHDLELSLGGSKQDVIKAVDRSFDRAFHLSSTTSSDSSIKYLVRSVDRLTSDDCIDFSAVEHHIVRAMVNFPHCLDYCILLYLKQHELGATNEPLWSGVLAREFSRHMALSHDHEVAWILTAVLGTKKRLVDVKFSADANRQICNTLLMKCLDEGLISFDQDSFFTEVLPESEVNSNWLLSNEVVANDWGTASFRRDVTKTRQQVVGENCSFLDSEFYDRLNLEDSDRAIPDRYNRYDDGIAEEEEEEEDDLDIGYVRAMDNDRT